MAGIGLEKGVCFGQLTLYRAHKVKLKRISKERCKEHKEIFAVYLV